MYHLLINLQFDVSCGLIEPWLETANPDVRKCNLLWISVGADIRYNLGSRRKM